MILLVFRPFRTLIVTKILPFLVFGILFSQVEEIGDSSFTINHNSELISIPYYSNEHQIIDNEQISRIVLIVHGQNRNANDYYSYIFNISTNLNLNENTLVLAPQFLLSQDISFLSLSNEYAYWSGTSQWTGGYLSSSTEQNPRPVVVSSFAIMDSLIQFLDHSYTSVDEIVLAGYSAGGQFVNRYASGSSTTAGGKVEYVVAAPSHYLYFNDERSQNNFEIPIIWDQETECAGYNHYRYGLENLNSYMGQINIDTIRYRYSSKSINYLIGNEDNGGTSYCESSVQGEGRYQRALVYYNHLISQFGENVIENHKIAIISNVSHDAAQAFGSDCGVFSVFESGGCEQMSNLTFPVSNFTLYNNEGEYPLEVSFVNESVQGTYEITQNQWNFGEGTLINSNNIIESYIYSRPGEFDVSLVSYDILGLSDSLRQQNIIKVDTLFGDFDFNANINQNDANLILESIVNLSFADSLQSKVGDVNKNEMLTSYDASLILQYHQDVIDTLPYFLEAPLAEGQIFSESQAVNQNDIITLPIVFDDMENIKSFSFRVQYNEVFLDYGSFYAPGLNDLGFLIKTNNQGSTVLIAAASANNIPHSDESINLYFTRTDSAFFETSILIDNISLNDEITSHVINVLLYDELSNTAAIQPENISISQNYPNPFNPRTSIDYHINKDCLVSADIYDVKGVLVRMLFSEFKVKGSHTVSWDGRDYKGNSASSGIYYFRVKVDTYVESKKMLLIR